MMPPMKRSQIVCVYPSGVSVTGVVVNGTAKVANISDLEQSVKSGKLRDLPGMGAKTEENILRGIRLYRILKPDMTSLIVS